MERLSLYEVAPEAMETVNALERYVRGVVEPRLLDLVKLRASMLNGCAFCVDMHTTDAMAAGEDPRKLIGLAAWPESPFYTKSERAALALTDAMTRIGDAGVSDDVYTDARAVFDDEQLAGLIMAVATINVWNRLGVTLHAQPPALAET